MAGEIPVPGQSVLLITASRTTLEQMRRCLNRLGADTTMATTAVQAVEIAGRLRPGLALLDFALPGLTPFRLSLLRDGLDGRLILVVAGLGPGRFDFYPLFSGETHPDWPAMLAMLQSLGTLLRDGPPAGAAAGSMPLSDVLRLDGLVLDPMGYRVTLNGRPVDLTPSEFMVLWTLAAEPGRVLRRDELRDSLRRNGLSTHVHGRRVIDVHVTRLRQKLGQHWIETVRGVGYRLYSHIGKKQINMRGPS